LQNQDNIVTTVHGTLLEISSVGVLLVGPSGIGKSDTAIELITTGAKLISDDVVVIKLSEKGQITGASPNKTKYLMEVRGLGIINIKDLFGSSFILENINIDMVIELAPWDSNNEYDRLCIEGNIYKILGVKLPYILLPLNNIRHAATIVDIAVRNHIFKQNHPESRDNILEELQNVNPLKGVR